MCGSFAHNLDNFFDVPTMDDAVPVERAGKQGWFVALSFKPA